MRARRLRRDAPEVPILPTYELVLSPEEEARATTKTLENIEKGSKLMLKCTMAQEHFENLVFRSNNVEIGESSGQSKTLTINSFSLSHTGMYECGATRKKDGKYHSRQMRVKSKREINSDLPPCSSEFDGICGTNGICLMDGSRQICHCDIGYMGETCDKVLMGAYDVKLLKVVGGTTTSLNLVCIIIAILFALLYFKERKSVRRLRREFGKAAEECEMEHAIYKETTTTTTSNSHETTNEGNTPGFARNSIRKMRLALNRVSLKM
ncbi:EGF-like domain-containing protein [Caenorhabditis elegans]|uniref:EGF-like domain-containing protein n=1 Tax=Caenorhabditis elegans TaxID=6239 RepID=U4PAZ4_CAEEL|nr:EGF-like domain-containing protein [Caenorhabditis elegans]CDH92928.1 EGF-like domain-containing protein [Caenorhabditis elegans]|eukprot:NP_001294245.1 IG (immunoglobulin), EGF and transmmembrane domain [Caenorhabditis elegans]